MDVTQEEIDAAGEMATSFYRKLKEDFPLEADATKVINAATSVTRLSFDMAELICGYPDEGDLALRNKIASAILRTSSETIKAVQTLRPEVADAIASNPGILNVKDA